MKINNVDSPLIVCFGDSLVEGYPYGAGASWVAAAEKAAGGVFRMLNFGVCGECVDDIFYRLKYYRRPEGVTHLLLLGGMNDIIQGKPLSFTLKDFARAFDFAEEAGLPLVFVPPYPTGERALDAYIKEMRERLAAEFKGRAALWLDFAPCVEAEMRDTEGRAFLDGVHPTARTYAAMGVYAAKTISEFLGGNKDGFDPVD